MGSDRKQDNRKYLTVNPGCSFTRLTLVYMAGILIASCQLVVLDKEQFRGHITIPTSVNAMLLGFFLSDRRATTFWRTKLVSSMERLHWCRAARPNGARGAENGVGGNGGGGGHGGGGGGITTTNRISVKTSVNVQPMMELSVRDLP